MDQDFKPALKLMLFLMIMLWMFATCTGCTLSRGPAQQQTIQSSPVASQAAQSVPVEQIDIDGDGTISAEERQSLTNTSDQVLPTFVAIIMCVTLVSVACAWMARGRRRGDPG